MTDNNRGLNRNAICIFPFVQSSFSFSLYSYPTTENSVTRAELFYPLYRDMLTIAMLLLPVVIFSVVIVHAIRVFILRIGLVVVMMMPVLIFPRYLLVVTYHRSGKMMKRVHVVISPAVSIAVYICGRPILDVIIICGQCPMKLYSPIFRAITEREGYRSISSIISELCENIKLISRESIFIRKIYMTLLNI